MFKITTSRMDNESEQNDYSDYSEDEDLGLLKKALYVELPENFDPNKIPSNGEEYLQKVMYEARNCPALKVAPVDSIKIKPPTKVQMIENCMKAPPSMLPSMSWQLETIKDFTKFRKFMSKELENYPNSKKKDNLAECLTGLPKLATVAALTQEDKIKVLETILSQLNNIKKGKPMATVEGVWIYSILATLEIPLCPDTCHILREVARKCSQIRSSLEKSAVEKDYVTLNLIICLIARFYRQLDLADE